MGHMLSPARPVRVAVVLAWMVLLTYWSSQPDLPIDRPFIARLLFELQHRAAHLVAFGTLALLARWAFEGFPRAAVLAVLLTSGFGVSDELHQMFTPRRHPGVDDWLVDTLAACLAMLAWPRLFASRSLVRTLAPAVVASMFVVGTLLAVATSAQPSLPAQISRPALQVFPAEIADGARELARSTRAFVARL